MERVRESIAAAARRVGRRSDEITIVGVSKTFPPEAVRAAYGAGLRHFGESRVQECEAKRQKLGYLDVTWHMIGHLQSNKARKAVQLFRCIDSLDTLALAEKLEAIVSQNAPGAPLPVLIEVHLGDEQAKTGAREGDLTALADGVERLAHLELHGLMTIPPYAEDPERARPYFKRLRDLRDRLSRELGRALPVLSMGMSHDFDIAIEEGATEVRIGRAIFGVRTLLR